ncbi:MAG: hypothetical protein FIB01_11190, partial [Gemmatimonadetes bacterium]|nr:hypothetical protein [Gemmatimonadota bacterium]
MHPALLDAMLRQPAFREVAGRVPPPGAALDLSNLPGSAPALLLAALARRLERRMFVVVAHAPADAEAFEADLHALLGEAEAVLFPQRETLPYEAAEHHLEVSGLRVEAVETLLAGRTRILVTTARALQELAEIPQGLSELRLSLRVGQALAPTALAGHLDRMGFTREPLVEAVGEYAVRGGLIALFGFGAPDPIRIEFWGDEIESIRRFDILDQRSSAELGGADILPV